MSKGLEMQRTVTLETLTDRFNLSEAGHNLIKVISQPEARLMTVTDICKVANISRDSYYRLFRQQDFINAYYEACRVTSIQAAMPAMQALSAQAAGGDVAACKAMLELNGLYQNTATINVNQDNKPSLKDILKRKAHK